MEKPGGILPTPEELQLIKEFLILPIILSVFVRDQKIISAAVKTPEPYNQNIQQAMDRIVKDLAGIKSEFRRRGIRVFDEKCDQNGARCKYLCRGYQSEFPLLHSFLRAEVAQRMSRYLGGQNG
ncbi:hypothetical protein ACE41H_21460 [Paenibacillus enshidis]|uniref:Uncharacterized protein n=1 Tax=Paenibacillus enshidis TaxID=1458439 RepID=A0ABV5AYN6_9BACL